MHIWDDKFGHQTFRYKKYAYTKSKTGHYVSLYGDKLKRITKWEKDQSDLFESDVNPEIRVLVDNYTDSDEVSTCLLYTSPSPRDRQKSRMPSSA